MYHAQKLKKVFDAKIKNSTNTVLTIQIRVTKEALRCVEDF